MERERERERNRTKRKKRERLNNAHVIQKREKQLDKGKVKYVSINLVPSVNVNNIL
jgi:hypothetical protein